MSTTIHLCHRGCSSSFSYLIARLFSLKNASQILKSPSSAHPYWAGTTTEIRTHLFRYRTKRLTWSLATCHVAGGQETAEKTEQAQGSHGTKKGDPNPENAQILQEPASNLVWKKTRMEGAMAERAALLRRHFLSQAPWTFSHFKRSFSLSLEQAVGCCRHHRLRYSETGDTADAKQHKITPQRKTLRLYQAVCEYAAPILALLLKARAIHKGLLHALGCSWGRFWLSHPVEGPDELGRALHKL